MSYNFLYKNSHKITLYNNVYLYLLNKNDLKFNNKKNSIYLFNNFLKNKTNKNYNNILFNFYSNYFINFFSFFLNKKIFFCIKKLNYLINNLKKNKIIEFMSKKLKKYYNFAGNSLLFKQLVDILWIAFLLKDSKFFLNWFVDLMEKIYLKNHKKFLNLLKLIFTRYYNFFFLNLAVLGIFFDIRGKLGVTGSAKKRHMRINSGTFSSTKKKNKISFSQSVVRTNTGVLGVTFCIFF